MYQAILIVILIFCRRILLEVEKVVNPFSENKRHTLDQAEVVGFGRVNTNSRTFPHFDFLNMSSEINSGYHKALGNLYL